jgi:hypothetical protein
MESARKDFMAWLGNAGPAVTDPGAPVGFAGQGFRRRTRSRGGHHRLLRHGERVRGGIEGTAGKPPVCGPRRYIADQPGHGLTSSEAGPHAVRQSSHGGCGIRKGRGRLPFPRTRSGHRVKRTTRYSAWGLARNHELGSIYRGRGIDVASELTRAKGTKMTLTGSGPRRASDRHIIPAACQCTQSGRGAESAFPSADKQGRLSCCFG